MLGARTRALGAGLIGRAAPTKAPAKGGAGGKKAGKGEGRSVGPTVGVEERESTVVGANILKEGSDPSVRPDSEYPEWVWGLLEKEETLGELRRTRVESMAMRELQRLVKLDGRQKIKELNSQKAKA